MVNSYKQTVDMDISFDEAHLQGFHFVCLVFGIVTIGLAAATLLKLVNQSELFLGFFIKWNVFRCVFAFGCIIYVCIEISHILTIFLSCFVLIIDLCASTYFTGIIASYLKVLENPDGQETDNQKHPNIQLISHVRTPDDKISSADITVDIPSKKPNGTELSVMNTVVDEPVEEHVKNNTSCPHNSHEPTRRPQVETVEVVIETNHSNDVYIKCPESTTEINDNVTKACTKHDEVNRPLTQGDEDAEMTSEKSTKDEPSEDKPECSMGQDNQFSDPSTTATEAATSSNGVIPIGVSNLGFETTERPNLKVEGGNESEGGGGEEKESEEGDGSQGEKRGSENEEKGSDKEERGSEGGDKGLDQDERGSEREGKGLDKDESGSDKDNRGFEGEEKGLGKDDRGSKGKKSD